MKSAELYEKILLSTNKKRDIIYHENSDKIAVIVDPRFDEVMEAVIRNFMYFMNPKGWNLLIVSHSNYYKEIKEKFPTCILYLIEEKEIHYKKVLVDNVSKYIPNITQQCYNSIFMNIVFWKAIPANNVAIFQKDCIMYKMFDDEFLEYDYAGANTFVEYEKKMYYEGINGGFSLRKRDAMIQCIEKATIQNICDYKKFTCHYLNITNILENYMNEDLYFMWACEMLNFKIPNENHRNNLSIEGYVDEAN